jgi:hypothetical protein
MVRAVLRHVRPLLIAVLVCACDPMNVDLGDAGVDRDAGPPAIDAAIDDRDAGASTGTPMFIATGKYGRITTSCDDGRTWSFDRSDDDGASCAGIDCDHHPGSATGVTFSGDHFFASFGWGDHPARILRSPDGTTWDTVYDARGFSFAGIAWAGSRLVSGDAAPRYSDDLGVSFVQVEWPPYDIPEGAWPNARQIHAAGNTVVQIVAEGGGTWADTIVSRDGGLTYVHPNVVPEECRGHSRPLAHGDGVWLQLWATTGVVCRSIDDGDTWTAVDVTDGDLSNVVWTGDEFVFFAGRTGWRSADGSAWTSFEANVAIGVFAHDPRSGTYAAAYNGGWGAPYENQRFYRSADAVAWEELPAGSFEQSHPITHMAFGVAQNASCP